MLNLLWIFGIAAGAVMVVKAEWFYQNFGTITWAEENLGTSGGSRLFYKLFGIILAIISVLGLTGLLGGLVLGIFGGLFKGMAPGA